MYLGQKKKLRLRNFRVCRLATFFHEKKTMLMYGLSIKTILKSVKNRL